ncbi:hypothetical protein GCQ56_04645 [Marinifilum sp. N1E240]|uniref:DUF6146 family protein n=1 Tax=Marinifilum sp. N1E240 TaxID=2608082 RepID=UPI00128B750B|nr:DUF6146 family protein [Marinifilum sp. N1E240]MPQ46289.1 hypothetical protein [Marinifilum sp. N1E240]
MKNLILILFISLIIGACSSYSSLNKSETQKVETAEAIIKDSTEYELLILDIGFESWFATRNTSSTAHSNSYYRNWNQQYISEWNRLHTQGHPYFENYIDYSPFEKYGFDINYKLYHYFLFVEDKTGITLVRRGR